MSSVEQRLARLENHISQQSKKIDEQASLILKLSTENERQALALARLEREERASTRSIQHISEFVFTSGEWAEEGTKLRRWKAAQSWKQGDEGPQKWEWLSYNKSPAESPFHKLPAELIAMILENMDLPTLAILACVSFDFLGRTSPLLYKEITVDGKTASTLFCERTVEQLRHNRRILPFLSFENTRKITLDNGPNRPSLSHPLAVSFARFGSSALNLDSVAVRAAHPVLDLEFWTPMLCILNPYHVKLYGSQNDQFRYPKVIGLPLTGAPFLNFWTRLESVTSMGEIVFTNHHTGAIALIPNRQPSSSSGRRSRHVEYQIHQAPPKGEGNKTIETLDPDRVLEILAERYTRAVGLWTYLRCVLVDDPESVVVKHEEKDVLMTTPTPKSRKGGKRRKGGGGGGGHRGGVGLGA